MTTMNWKSLLAVVAAGALVMSGCSGADGKDGINGTNGQNGQDGDDGATGPTGPVGPTGPTGPMGPTGPAGQDLTATAKPESCVVCHPDSGSIHQGIYNQYTDASTLAISNFNVTSVANGTNPANFDVTMTFQVTKGGVAYVDAGLAAMEQKRYMAAHYDGTKYDAYYSFGSLTNSGNTYTVTATNVAFAPEQGNAFVYVYLADGLIPAGSSYTLYTDVVNAGRAYGTVGAWESAATVSGCEKCHGAPYQKHGYRAAVASGLPDMAACKGCHGDNRNGSHLDWQVLVDDVVRYTQLGATPLTAAEQAKYAYKASTMNDTHMSHAMEFAYPQSMANCVACHEGKLDVALADANFTLATCRSCHPVTGVGGTDAKRAPALAAIVPGANAAFNHSSLDLYSATDNCGGCHIATMGPRFNAVHSGYSAQIYADATTRYQDTIATAITSASFDAGTNVLTVNFDVTGAAAQALIQPTVVVSLYGYDTKDFVVSGHGSQPAPDGKRNLEWAEGDARNSPRLTVTPDVATQGNATWTATANLSLWASRITDGSVKRVEIAVLPKIGADQTVAVSTTNLGLAVSGVSKTFDLGSNAIVADAQAYGREIVSVAKCNACHDALATTFHGPNYGSAGVVGCRVCHVVGSGGSHLELQSRSIDSYVHAIHSMQPFDIGDVNFADPVAKLKYEHHVESTYPNFTTMNCESCHNPGTYEVPDQTLSLVGVLSGTDVVNGYDARTIGTMPSVVVGPGARACGACHRAQMINENAAGHLAAFNGHTAAFGTSVDNGTGVFDAAVAKIMAFFK